MSTEQLYETLRARPGEAIALRLAAAVLQREPTPRWWTCPRSWAPAYLLR